MSLGPIFDDIYRRNVWKGRESRSGEGAGDRERATLAPAISELVADLGVRSVLDLGCGETYWTPDLPGYTGIDVSIEALTTARVHHPGWDLRVDDGTPFPQKDLVLCRCVMQHLSYASIGTLLERVDQSRATWLLATTYALGRNENIRDGGFFRISLRSEPLNFTEPLRLLPDESAEECYLGLWKVGNIR